MQTRRRESSSEAHRFHGRRWHDDHRTLLLQRFVEHVHGAQVERRRIVLIDERRGGKLIRTLGRGEATADDLLALMAPARPTGEQA